MAGEITKTEGLVLAISPWSQTSHVVAWLTPDAGPVTTLVKGAVRPKSAFLGAYDLYGTGELLYYAHARGGLHALRETVALTPRDGLRGNWRATALAGYAARFARELAPAGREAADWFAFLNGFFDVLAIPARRAAPRDLVAFECRALALAGLAPDFSGARERAAGDDAPDAPAVRFAIDRGCVGEGERTVLLAPDTIRALRNPERLPEDDPCSDALRFLGLFIGWHLDFPADVRRATIACLRERETGTRDAR